MQVRGVVGRERDEGIGDLSLRRMAAHAGRRGTGMGCSSAKLSLCKGATGISMICTDVAYQGSWMLVTYEWTDLEQALCSREIHRVILSNPMTHVVLLAPIMVYSYRMTGILNVLCPLTNQ